MYRVECDPDVALVSLLTSVPKRRIMHHQGKNELLRKMLKQNDSVGLIDKDPSSIQPTVYLQRFQVMSYSDNDEIEVLHHNQGHNRLIVLYPRLEEWIIESARRVKVSLKGYNLPANGSELHEIISFKINRFEELLDDLKQSSDRVKTLKRRLTEPF
jgi:hypothetical protein